MENPLSLFKEEMANDQISVRINAIHRLTIIATLVGEQSVRNDILPILECIIF